MLHSRLCATTAMGDGSTSGMGMGSEGAMSAMDMSGGDMSRKDMSGMAMGGMAMDLNDFNFDAYLANDRTLSDPEVIAVEKGSRVRLRIVNAVSATVFWIDTGLPARLVAVDGHVIVPLPGTRFGMAMAQRLDIKVDLPGNGAFPVLALREGARERTGVICSNVAASRTAHSSYGTCPCIIGARFFKASRIADMHIMRSITTPVAPLCASAAAPSDDRAIAPSVLFLNIFHLSDCCIGRAQGPIGTTSDARRRCIKHGVDGCQKDGVRRLETLAMRRIRCNNRLIRRHHEHGA